MREKHIFNHEVHYFKLDNIVFGVIPSMDVAFTPKADARLVSGIKSEKIPYFYKTSSVSNRIKRVFVLTDGCNLQCSYCFEGKHIEANNMTPDMISNAILSMFEEAQKKNKKIISFSLFGGEPSMNWRAVLRAVETAKLQEQKTDIVCKKAIVTNGVMSKDKIEYLIKNMDYIYFSLDGPKELFLKQRRPKGGNILYDTIINNAKIVYDSGEFLSFKITVTSYTISYLREIDDFFANNFPTCPRLYQPCMVDEDDELYISFEDFLQEYSKLEKYSLFPKTMSTTLFKNMPSDRFCNLMIRNVVYPDGSVLACHRSNMCIPDDLVRKQFTVGKCDSNGKIERIPQKEEKLKLFTVNNFEGCKKCAIRYHCCGGCAVIKLLSGNGNMFRPADYCDGLKKYAYTNIVSRLTGKVIPMINKTPINVKSDCAVMEEKDFLDDNVEKIIKIEE